MSRDAFWLHLNHGLPRNHYSESPKYCAIAERQKRPRNSLQEKNQAHKSLPQAEINPQTPILSRGEGMENWCKCREQVHCFGVGTRYTSRRWSERNAERKRNRCFRLRPTSRILDSPKWRTDASLMASQGLKTCCLHTCDLSIRI